MASKNWLFVESFQNYQSDKANNFSYFGITQRFQKLVGSIMPNDRIFTYVTGKSCFSDIRQVTKPGVRKLHMGGDYELSLPLCVDTEPVLILEQEKWLSIHAVRDQLILTKSLQHWGQVFRSAPRHLDVLDAKLLEAELQAHSLG